MLWKVISCYVNKTETNTAEEHDDEGRVGQVPASLSRKFNANE